MTYGVNFHTFAIIVFMYISVIDTKDIEAKWISLSSQEMKTNVFRTLQHNLRIVIKNQHLHQSHHNWTDQFTFILFRKIKQLHSKSVKS